MDLPNPIRQSEIAGESRSESTKTSGRSDEVDYPLIRQDARPGIPGFYAHLPIGIKDWTVKPLVICVHGISRDAREQVELFLPEALSRGYAILAPHFDQAAFGDYQRLGRRGRGGRADLGLIQAWSELELAADYHFGPIYLFGFSGGGQFVHRFVMAHPNRIAAAVVASAGWFTEPEPRRRFPRGLRVDGDLTGVHLEPENFLRVPTLVTVGTRDTKRDSSVRTNPRLDQSQGRNRLERARCWSEKMCMAAQDRGIEPRTRYEELHGVGHSFRKCVENGLSKLAFDFFDSSGEVIDHVG